ncbi:MAG: hypothetical protein NAOJABEB_00501 [Steroidobacteraceae bacterium]|nr:hypothetical protein [Steroidobacteraceae bacterium]
MNRLTRTSLFVALLGVAGAAQAQFSSTVTATSDYDFRGVSLSAKNPALQASLDYAFGETGFSVGAWASNIDYGNDIDGTLELDLYAGYEASINDDLSWNAGLVWYTYPGSDNTATRSKISSYPELSAGVDWKGLGLKQWLAIDYGGSNDTALYTEANYTFPLPQNFSFTLHAGYNWGDAFDGFEYLDYGATIGVDVGKFSLALKLTGTDNSGADKVTDDVFNNEARVLFQISTTFPWSE